MHLALAHEVDVARGLALLLQPVAAQRAALLEGVAQLLHLVRARARVRVRIRLRLRLRLRVRHRVRLRLRLRVRAPGHRSSLGYRARRCAAAPPRGSYAS